MVFCSSSISEAYCTGSAAGGGLGDRLRGGRSADATASWTLADRAVFRRDLYTDGSVSFSRHS